MLDADESLRNYVEDKVRYDYDPCRDCLTIRMPSPVYDTFCIRINNNGPLANFAKEVKHFAISRILIPKDTEDKPDISFGYRQALYLGVIVESRRISYLADKYILNTDRSVNAVVVLDIDYEGSNRATITVWRPEYIIVDSVEEFRATIPFRTDSGLLTEGIVLRLSLRDFVTEELVRGYMDLDCEILITSKQLCDFLLSAEARQQA
ncbi:hypothetical protein N7527_000101 [Penicillium freii]|nr:hypothetical protein N7527_000101 [Penicillium freii]